MIHRTDRTVFQLKKHQVSPKIPSVDGLFLSVDGLLVAGSPQPPLGEKDLSLALDLLHGLLETLVEVLGSC
jgi:hypothetical protein